MSLQQGCHPVESGDGIVGLLPQGGDEEVPE